MLSLKEPPMRILFLLARQFNLIMQVKELSAAGHDQNSIAKKTGLQPFVVRSYSQHMPSPLRRILPKMWKTALNTEAKVKTGLMTDTMSVELLLVKFSR